MSGLEGLLNGRLLVDRYRIEEVIGRGGFAAVYRAADERLGRPVAVKVITYPAPDAETRDTLRQRFQREARAAASLPQHPNVVTVHDFGTDPDLGMDFLVMELLDGVNLATYLNERGRPPLDEALCVLRDATEGLSIGHRAGLVHRDVKPGNIFLARTHGDEAFRVCILDFGIAQVVADERAGAALTRTGFVPHSPAYASPEQMRGESQLTPAADVFSLGVVGYQLLTGERPFGTEPRSAPGEWVPARRIRELSPEAPPAVVAVVERALAFDPAERYPDASAMGEALDAATGGADRTVAVPAAVAAPPAAAEDHTLMQPPAAPAPPPRPRAAPPAHSARRSTSAWALGGVAAVALAVAGVWALGGGGGGSDDAEPRTVVVADSLPPPPDAGDPADAGEPEAPAPEADAGGLVQAPAAAPPQAAPPAGATTTAPVAPQPGAAPAGGTPAPVAGQAAPPAAQTPVRTAPAQQQQTQQQTQQQQQQTQQQAPPQQQQQPKPDTARAPEPRLLGKPVERRPAPRPAKPDSTGARADSITPGGGPAET